LIDWWDGIGKVRLGRCVFGGVGKGGGKEEKQRERTRVVAIELWFEEESLR
jgi:hypothetical protein